MKTYSFFLLAFLFLVSSCTDTITDLGKGIQPVGDQISVGTDTIHLNTQNVFVDYIYSRPDSFLLGSFYDTKFGTTQADILAQVNCPEGFKFPSNAVPDSAKIILNYYTCYGDTASPLDLNIYEMNKQTFSYTGLYPSNINPADYTDRSLKLGERIIRAGKNSGVSKAIEFKLDNSFIQRFFDSSHYTSTADFLSFFKGIYITANFGASTLLNIGLVNLKYFYHYNYMLKNINGQDSLATVNDYLLFPANQEVRQVNRIVHPDRLSMVQNRDSVNYIASPANIQTRIGMPLNRIQNHMNAGINGKKLEINSALIRVDVTEAAQDTILHPIVKYIMLVKETSMDRIFNNDELPSDTCSVLGAYNSTQIGSTGVYEQYYTFNISKLVANELKVAKDKGIAPATNMNLRLVPVSVQTSTSSTGTVSISSVKQQYLMNAITIRSGQNTTAPMKLNIVYSGF
jgi:hypothetical protein